jgi:hypothetical protein
MEILFYFGKIYEIDWIAVILKETQYAVLCIK